MNIRKLTMICLLAWKSVTRLYHGTTAVGVEMIVCNCSAIMSKDCTESDSASVTRGVIDPESSSG